jgi:hypothetical protein
MTAPHGFEPWITEPESVVLPVTLRGNTKDFANYSKLLWGWQIVC